METPSVHEGFRELAELVLPPDASYRQRIEVQQLKRRRQVGEVIPPRNGGEHATEPIGSPHRGLQDGGRNGVRWARPGMQAGPDGRGRDAWRNE